MNSETEQSNNPNAVIDALGAFEHLKKHDEKFMKELDDLDDESEDGASSSSEPSSSKTSSIIESPTILEDEKEPYLPAAPQPVLPPKVCSVSFLIKKLAFVHM